MLLKTFTEYCIAIVLSMNSQSVPFLFLRLLREGKSIRIEQCCDDASSLLQCIRANELVVVLHRYGTIHALFVCHFEVVYALSCCRFHAHSEWTVLWWCLFYATVHSSHRACWRCCSAASIWYYDYYPCTIPFVTLKLSIHCHAVAFMRIRNEQCCESLWWCLFYATVHSSHRACCSDASIWYYPCTICLYLWSCLSTVSLSLSCAFGMDSAVMMPLLCYSAFEPSSLL